MNPEKYLNNFDCDEIFKQILKKHNIDTMEENYNRHFAELKKKIPVVNPNAYEKTLF